MWRGYPEHSLSKKQDLDSIQDLSLLLTYVFLLVSKYVTTLYLSVDTIYVHQMKIVMQRMLFSRLPQL